MALKIWKSSGFSFAVKERRAAGRDRLLLKKAARRRVGRSLVEAVELLVVEVEKNVNIQDVVYTSGLGKILENIPIGVIKNIEKTNYGNVAEVSLFVNLNNVNFVAILKDVL